MNRNYVFNDASEALKVLLHEILTDGSVVPSRAGDTREFTQLGITLRNPNHRELLLEHRKPNIAAQIAETMWVLAGRDDMEFLARYLPRATDFSDDGKTWRAGYGARLRRWEGHSFMGDMRVTDQLAYIVDTLQRDPGSRQAVMSIWDPNIDTQPGKDIPCNDWLHFLSRAGMLDLHVAIRSNDAIWGWSGINQFEWSALLEVVAGLTGQKAGSLHFSVTSWHLYEHHWEKAHRIATAPEIKFAYSLKASPRFKPRSTDLWEFDDLVGRWFVIEESIRGGHVHAVAVEDFPEPMLQSWLRVLQWWWTGNTEWLVPLKGTRLELACQLSVQPKVVHVGTINPVGGHIGTNPAVLHAGERVDGRSTPEGRKFTAYVTELHNEKHAAYGDSWKRRGEMLGIMANIARKIDRLGGGETADETSADTAIDLLVYLAKYRCWLTRDGVTDEYPDRANALIRDLERKDHRGFAGLRTEAWLTEAFEQLEEYVTKHPEERLNQVDRMLPVAYRLAFQLWLNQEQLLAEPDLGFVGGDHDLP